MSSGQKVAFSLLISVLAFCAFTVVAFSGLFDLLEVNFYQPIVQEIKQKKIDEIAAAQNEYFDTLMKRFDAFSVSPDVKTYAETRPSDESAKNREILRAQLVTSTQALFGIRIIDDNGRNVYYSTFQSDIISGSKGISYRNYDSMDELSYDSVHSKRPVEQAAPSDSKCRIIKDGDKNRLIFSLPFYNIQNEFIGTILFYCDAVNFSQFLYNRNLIDIKGFAKLVTAQKNQKEKFDGFGGFVFGLPNYGKLSIEKEILENWRSGTETFWKLKPVENLTKTPGEESEILDKSKNNSVCAFSYKNSREDFGFITLLYDENELKFPPYIRILLLVTAFVTLYLAIFLILSFKHDDIVVIRDKVRRYENEFFISYKKMGDGKSPEYLAEQKPVLERRILKSLGKKGEKYAAEFKSIFESYWQEMLASFGESSPLAISANATPAINAEELKKIVRSSLEDILENGKFQINAAVSSEQKIIRNEQLAMSNFEEMGERVRSEELGVRSDVGESPRAKDVDDVEEIPEADDVEETEELDEVEEVSEAESVEEVESVEDVESLDEVEEAETVEEVESVEEADDLDEVEEIPEAEDVESLDEVEDAESVEEVESVEDAEEIPEAESVEEAEELDDVEEIPEAEEVESLDEVEDAESVEEVESVEDAEELDDVEEIPEAESVEEVESVEDAEELDEVEEVSEAEDVEELDEVEEVSEAESVEEVESVEDVESLDEVEDAESVEEVESVEDVESLDEVENAESIEEVESVEDAEEIPEAESVEEAEELDAVEEIPEAEDVESLDEVGDAESVEEVESVEDVESVEEAEELDDVEEIPEAEDVESPDELENAESIEEVESLDEVEDAESVEEVESVEEAEELDDVEEIPEAEDVESLDVLEDADTVEEVESVEEAEELDEIEELSGVVSEADVSDELEPISDIQEELRIGDGRDAGDDGEETNFSTVTEEERLQKFDEELEMLPEVSEHEEQALDMARTLAALPERPPHLNDDDNEELDSEGLSRKFTNSELHDIEKLKDAARSIDEVDTNLEELETFDPTKKGEEPKIVDPEEYIPHLLDNNVSSDDDVYKDEVLLEKIEFGVPSSDIVSDDSDGSAAENFVAASVDYSGLDEDDFDDDMYESVPEENDEENEVIFENPAAIDENQDENPIESDENPGESDEISNDIPDENPAATDENQDENPSLSDEIHDEISQESEKFSEEKEESAEIQYTEIEEPAPSEEVASEPAEDEDPLDDADYVVPLEYPGENMPFMFTKFGSDMNSELMELAPAMGDAIVQDSDGTFHVTEFSQPNKLSLNMDFKKLVDSILR